jgi:hypothetical protein
LFSNAFRFFSGPLCPLARDFQYQQASKAETVGTRIGRQARNDGAGTDRPLEEP